VTRWRLGLGVNSRPSQLPHIANLTIGICLGARVLAGELKADQAANFTCTWRPHGASSQSPEGQVPDKRGGLNRSVQHHLI
jgi:hypothetical protein